MADFLSLLEPIANTALSRAVGPVTFRSQLHAPITVDPFAPGEPAPPDKQGFSLMAILKPEIEVELPTGRMVYAPYGHPSANYGPFILAGFGLFALSLVGLGGLSGRFMSGTQIALAAGGGVAALAWVATHGKLEDKHHGAEAGSPSGG